MAPFSMTLNDPRPRFQSLAIIINGDGGCRLWQLVQADSQPMSSGLVLGRRPLGAVLHSSNEPDKLLQWNCRDDSTTLSWNYYYYYCYYYYYYYYSYNGIVTVTYTRLTQECHFEWPWVTLSDLVKYVMRRSFEQFVCDSWVSCYSYHRRRRRHH